MTLETFDLVVIGGGNAGVAAAGVARRAGWRVALIEEDLLGGTCPNRGCVPKKVLVAVAESLDVIARAGAQGITAEPVAVDWSRVIDRKEAILSGTSEAIEKDLEQRGIELSRGHARFVGPSEIAIGERRVTADNILVATGSVPRPLPIDGAPRLTSSDTLLELREPPRSMIFVGAGVIAFELGHVFARLGTRVTVLEATPRPLGAFDEEAVEHLVAATRELGVEVHTGVLVHAIEPHPSGLSVHFEEAGAQRSLVAEIVAHGAGRIPNVADLDLLAANVHTERGGIVTSSPYRSASNPAVWVAGDAVSGTPQLSPIATAEGNLAGRAILGEDVRLDYLSIPSCVYSVPTLATVGRTERAATEAGVRFEVKRNDMTAWRSGRSYAERHAWAKVLVGEDDLIVGAHLFGHGAAETINILGLAMKHGLRAADLKSFVWAYPTSSSDLKYLV